MGKRLIMTSQCT